MASIQTDFKESDQAEASIDDRVSVAATSREKTLLWNPLVIPPGLDGFPFSTRVSNLRVTIVEQTSPHISTRYIATGTYMNGTEDDKNHTSSIWTISLTNAGGVELDRIQFPLPRGHCSYSGEEPFRFEFPTPNNNFDLIRGGLASGLKPGGYEGGC